MIGGRLNKLPVSWYYHTAIRSETGLEAKTECSAQGSGDTGIILATSRYAIMNDDSPVAGGNGKGSYVASPDVTMTDYHLYVFSMRRGTSRCTLYTRSAPSATWRKQVTEEFGGTVVAVGPMRPGDFLEVQSPGGSGRPSDEDDTQMVLIDAGNADRGFRYSDDRTGSDHDPRIDITGAPWISANNLALLGKKYRTTVSARGVEAYVDLVRGPLDEGPLSSAFPDHGGEGTGIPLQAGRYFAWVYAATDSPVGYPSPGHNPASDMPGGKCPNYVRGSFDTAAFQLYAEQYWGGDERAGTPGRWRKVSSERVIPLGALGTGPGNGWNLFLIELSVNAPGNYRLVTTGVNPTVRFFTAWRALRNPDASELRVATFNTLYDRSEAGTLGEDGEFTAKTRNAADLLATRARVFPQALRVDEGYNDQFKFDADVVGLQELKRSWTYHPTEVPNPFEYAFGYAEIFKAQASSRDSRNWQYVKGRDEQFPTASGLGPLFVASNVRPVSENGIYFGPLAKSEAGCEDYGDLEYAECQLEGLGGVFAITNYGVPGKLSARRYGVGEDRPIAVVNVHLEADGDNSDHRRAEIQSLISTLGALLEREPGAFNAGSGNPARRQRQYHQNRIIVLGDFNMTAHGCGEHYWLLRWLRDAFGYAVDVALAGDFKSQGNHFGMHDAMGAVGPDGNPRPYTRFGEWRCHASYTTGSVFPWWSATHRSVGTDVDCGCPDIKKLYRISGNYAQQYCRKEPPTLGSENERYDAIMLVGLGWAYDDPVRDYLVMAGRSRVSPLNPLGTGVESWIGADDVPNQTGYAPAFDLGEGIMAGSPALHSDHMPVGAKLRVFLR
jgi:hypothetical protein